jgi:heat shock protein HslJ
MKNIILALVGIGLVVFIIISFKSNKTIAPVEYPFDNQVEEPTTPSQEELEEQNLSMVKERLSEGVWVWERTVMNDDTTITPNQIEAFTLTFTNGQVSGTTDCNGFGGPYELSGYNSIAFGEIMQTLMACENSQEEIFIKHVIESNSVYFDGEILALLLPYDSGSVLFKKK